MKTAHRKVLNNMAVAGEGDWKQYNVAFYHTAENAVFTTFSPASLLISLVIPQQIRNKRIGPCNA